MNPNTASSAKEKDFPEEWKALFLWIDEHLWLVEYVQEMISKILNWWGELRLQFINFYSEEYRVKVQQILDNKIQVDFPEASKLIWPFYKKLKVHNLINFKRRLKVITTPPL